VWVNDGRGRCVSDTARFVDADSARIHQCQLADLNGDGWPDLFAIVLTEKGSAARVHLNDNAGHFREAGEALRMNMLAAVKLGDINGDRLPDVFVVNLGMDRTAPPERMMQGRVAEVWLNTTRKPR